MSGGIITALPGCSATTVIWRRRGRLYLTVIAKAAFTLGPDDLLRRADPEPIETDDVPLRNHPLSSTRVPRESVPPLGRAEIIVNGHAYAPPSGPVSSMNVRMRFCSGPRVLIDKTLLVQAPAPFQKLPLVYERAYGGIGAAENPVGTGARQEDPPPNVIDPDDPRKPAGFGAIAQSWRSRRALLGSMRKEALHATILDLPDDLSWDYFHAAPPDQRTDLFLGGETLELYGMSPRAPCLTMRLPRIRGLARIAGGQKGDETIALKADSLRVEADEERCVILCRGSTLLSDVGAILSMGISAGVEIDGEPLRWEEAPAPNKARPPIALPGGDSAEGIANPVTLQLDEGDLELVDDAPPATVQIPAVAIAAQVAVPRATPASFDATIVSELTASPTRGEPGASLPFQPGAPVPVVMPSTSPPQPRRMTDTLDIEAEDPARRDVLPFYSSVPEIAAPPPREPAPAEAMTVPVPAPIQAPPEHVSPPPAPPPPDEAPAKPTRVYAGDREEPPPAAPPPAPKPAGPARVPAPPGPSVDLRRGLYGRFGK